MRFLPAAGFALFLLAATWCLRWPGLDKPIWNVDEAVTFTMAEQILAGEVPYRHAVDQRTPLAPYAQAAVFAAAGHWNLKAQHASISLLIGLTAVLLWRTARRLGEPETGVAGALWCTVLCLILPSVRDTMPAHTAWYLIFFSALGFWLLARAWTTGRAAWAAASGAAFGLSVLAKQPGVLDFGVAVVLLALAWLVVPEKRRALRAQLGALLAGFAAVLLLTAAWFALRGAWDDFVYYAWTYNRTLYVPEVPPLERWKMMRVPVELAWGYHPLVVILGGIAAVALIGRVAWLALRRPRRFDFCGWLILGWCASGLLSTTLSGRDFTHYSIQLIPGLSLACGWVFARAWLAGRRWTARSKVARAAALLAGAAVVAWLLQPVPARLRALDLPEPATDVMVRLIQRHTRAEDRIFVWGYNPEFYATARRLPATRFLYNTFVTGLIPWTNIDPLINTDYGVVPGARDALRADWAARPPALVVDTRTQRGFLKYRIENQPWLWSLVERDYAEVEPEAADQLGSWLFRRLDRVAPAPLPANLALSPEVEVRVTDTPPGRTARVQVSAPGDSRAVDLYLDGRLYRRLPWPADTAVSASFLIPGADRPGPLHRVQAVAVTSRGALAGPEKELRDYVPPTVIGGPPLEFDGRSLPALESRRINGDPILPKQEAPDHWDAHAPSRLVYPWEPGMNSLAFAYGLEEAAIAKDPPTYTDGIEVVVQVEDAGGRVTSIYRQYSSHLDARRTRGRIVGYTPLPKGGPGRIILLITPGPRNDAAFDWSYWQWVRADRSPLALLTGGVPLQPLRLDTPVEPAQAEFNHNFITVVGAPAVIDFPVQPSWNELSGRFGLLDTAWLGEQKTGPVDFVITLVKPDGATEVLFERKLDPAGTADDRGAKEFKFRLPQPLRGVLRFATRPGAHPAQAHAFWGGLATNLLRTSLQWRDHAIPARADSEGLYGFLNTEEEGRECLVAHAPATLAYDWREGLARITAEYGLMSAAYTKNETEGVVFVVETEDAAGARRELFRRHLAPLTVPADRGPQQLSVAIPPLPGGRIYLRTLPPPSGHLNAAWSYWRTLRAEE